MSTIPASSAALKHHFVNHKCTELSLSINNGLTVAVKFWGDEHADVQVLCLHGWLDNADSWAPLAPLLASSKRMSVRVAAMDWTGHGNSAHRSGDATYNIPSRVAEVHEVTSALGWDRFVLLAHSMGAGFAHVYAACYPERVSRLIVIDAIGLWPKMQPTSARIVDAVAADRKLRQKQRRVFATRAEAVDKYMSNNPYLHRRSAELLVRRSTEEVEVWDWNLSGRDAADDSGSDNNGDDSGSTGKNTKNTNSLRHRKATKEIGIRFRHDPRMVQTQLSLALTEEETLALCAEIEAPVLAVLSTHPVRRRGSNWNMFSSVWRRRCQSIPDMTIEVCEASHHAHMDRALDLFPLILDFIADPATNPRRGNAAWTGDDLVSWATVTVPTVTPLPEEPFPAVKSKL